MARCRIQFGLLPGALVKKITAGIAFALLALMLSGPTTVCARTTTEHAKAQKSKTQNPGTKNSGAQEKAQKQWNKQRKQQAKAEKKQWKEQKKEQKKSAKQFNKKNKTTVSVT
jgi:type III secretory pathway component EscR